MRQRAAAGFLLLSLLGLAACGDHARKGEPPPSSKVELRTPEVVAGSGRLRGGSLQLEVEVGGVSSSGK